MSDIRLNLQNELANKTNQMEHIDLKTTGDFKCWKWKQIFKLEYLKCPPGAGSKIEKKK